MCRGSNQLRDIRLFSFELIKIKICSYVQEHLKEEVMRCIFIFR
jgi:hypothetical protein